MMRTLFLNPPSFDGFDGGAGSRYQARREVRSFWYPTWLAQPAALVPDSRLVDAPARGLSLEDVVAMARDFELAVLHTSTPSFRSDVKVAEAMKAANPKLMIGLVGAHVAVSPEPSVEASDAIDFVCGAEFDFTVKEIAEGRPLATVAGLTCKLDGTRRLDDAAPGAARHGPAALRHARLPPRPGDRRLLHRLSDAPLRFALYRAGLQIALHLLSVAADDRRPCLSHPEPGECHRGGRAGEKADAAGEARSSSTTTPSPTTASGPRRSPAGWEGSASPGRATPRRTCPTRR